MIPEVIVRHAEIKDLPKETFLHMWDIITFAESPVQSQQRVIVLYDRIQRPNICTYKIGRSCCIQSNLIQQTQNVRGIPKVCLSHFNTWLKELVQVFVKSRSH